MLSKIFKALATWYLAHMTYTSIIMLMFIESTFFPLPSEIVIPPAVFKGSLNVFLIVICATTGAILGSLFNYYFALILGRKLLYAFADSKIGHLFFLTREKLEKAENYFDRHGKSSTFIGRLVPGIRHLISIPAGLAKMNIKHFILYTALGSFLWHSILAGLAYVLYINNITRMFEKYSKELSWTLLGVGIVFVIYLIVRFIKKRE